MPACNQRPHCRRAFTLIELLVVISITAVLVALLLPALSKSRDSARTAKCLINVRSISMLIQYYASDYHDGLVATRNFAPTGTEPTSRWFDNSRASLGSYLPTKTQSEGINTAWHCPSSPLLTYPNRAHNDTNILSRSTYHYNSRLQNCGNEAANPLNRTGYYSPAQQNPGVTRTYGWNRLHRIYTPLNQVGAIADGYFTINAASGQATVINTLSTFSAKSGTSWTTFAPPTGSGTNYGSPHAGTTNVAFLDGHSETMNVDKVVSRYRVTSTASSVFYPFVFND